ncbi:MAG: PLP-dependent aminotransferase family protein [Candidatus Eremiobacteraeota bacterium]|nr:PLP-dependent aminotransferase family protein [Candidatus Eremiobacteraeota bacterium]
MPAFVGLDTGSTRSPKLDIGLDPNDRRPLYVQIADQLVEAVESERLRPGDRLPAMRDLAEQLDCALVTVSQAYDLVAARGRVTSRVGKGTFVSEAPAHNAEFARRWEPDVGRFARAERMEGVLEQLTRATVPGAITLAAGHPAPETFPLHDFGRAMHRTLLDDPPESMQYRSTTGDRDLCETLAGLLRTRGCNASQNEIVVCSGAQQAADLVANVVLEQRSVVAAESPAYAGTLGVFDARGVTYVEVQGDVDGVRVDDVERVFSEYRPRLFYLNPIAQNPTGAVLPQRRAKQIVALARRYDVVILEDQTGWQLTYDAAAPPPLASFDTDGRVILLESLSKSIFPALRIGYLYCRGTLNDALELAKVRADVFTSTLIQRALWRFMTSPSYARHVRAARTLYRDRRDAFMEALTEDLPWAGVRPPSAGVNVWLPLPPRISTRAAFEECAREGVLVMPADPFYPTRTGPPAIRLSFGNLPEREAREGVRRVARALQRAGATNAPAAAST